MNRIKRFGSILLIFTLAIGLFMIPGELSVEAKAKKTVVIYFTGTGTTEKVAKKIKKATGGTLIKVKAKKPYTKKDLDWTNDNSRVCKEHNSAKSPAVSTVRPGISNLKKIKKAIKKANVVYIGYPIWWGEAPHIIYNLVEHVNIKGKTVVPFCTSQASGLGKSAKHLKGDAALNKTKWLSGKGWYEGSLPSQKKINKWVKKVTKKIKTAKAATSKPKKITTQKPSSLPQATVTDDSSENLPQATVTPLPLPTDNPSTDGGKTAVVYYSASGTTKARAQEVYQTLGSEQADLIEIVPEQVYTNDDLNWTNDNSRVSTEHNNTDADGRVSVRPELSAESKNVNLSEYKRIIIGYPIWWYDASWVTWSFLDYHRERLAGKTVIPFCTSASSSVDKSVETLKTMYPDMVIDESDAIRLTSSNAASWAEGLKKN